MAVSPNYPPSTGGAVASVDARTGVVTLSDLYEPLFADSAAVRSATEYPLVSVVDPAAVSMFTIPGRYLIAYTTGSFTLDTDYYIPIIVRETITVDRLACEVVSGQVAGTARIALYEANTSWQPGDLIEDFSTVSTATTGVKTVTPSGGSRIITPGRYLIAWNVTNSSVVYRAASSCMDSNLFRATLGANSAVAGLTGARAHGTFPDPGAAWTGVIGGTAAFLCPVWFRVTAISV